MFISLGPGSQFSDRVSLIPKRSERRKICSPWREPWETDVIDAPAAERRNIEANHDYVPPLRGFVAPGFP